MGVEMILNFHIMKTVAQSMGAWEGPSPLLASYQHASQWQKKCPKVKEIRFLRRELFSEILRISAKGTAQWPCKIFSSFRQDITEAPRDITDEALKAAEKGFRRLMEALRTVDQFDGQFSAERTVRDGEISGLIETCLSHMDDDFMFLYQCLGLCLWTGQPD